jgi:hypothetical protein
VASSRADSSIVFAVSSTGAVAAGTEAAGAGFAWRFSNARTTRADACSATCMTAMTTNTPMNRTTRVIIA